MTNMRNLILGLLLTCGSCLGQRYQQVPFPWGAASGNHLAPNALAFWQCNEASGNMTDASGNGQTLTAHGSPGSGTGIVAGSRTYSDTDPDYFTEAFNTAYGFAGGAFTITAWGQFDISAPHVDDKSIIARGDYSGTNFSWALIFDNATPNDLISFYWSTTGVFDAGNVISFDLGGDVGVNYYFICLRWNGSTLHLSATDQFSGSVAADVTASFSGTLWNSGSPTLSVGRLEGSSIHYMHGQLDEMGVWSRYLSDCEVSKLYTARAGSFTWPSFDNATCTP